MKIFGKWEELVEIIFRYSTFKNTVQPGTPSADVITVLPSAGGTLATLAGSEALTNKTIDGDSNTLQDIGVGSLKTVLGDANKVILRNASGVVISSAIANVNIDAAAAIAYSKLALSNSIVDADINTAAGILRSKLANGTADHVIINSAGGALTSEATLAKSRGGSGQDNSSLTFPASGTLATLAGNEVFTNKTLTAPVIDAAVMDGQASAPANPSAGYYKAYVSDSDGKLHIRDSSGNDAAVGSGSSGRNYLGDWFDGLKSVGSVTSGITATGNITISTTAWQGGDTSKLTIANVSSGGLRETKSLKLDHIATGATFIQSPNFTLDLVDLGKPVMVSFDVGTVAASDDYQVVMVRYNSGGTYQEQIVIAGTASATTPYSARIPAGSVTSFNGFFIASSTSTDYYALRFVRNSASDTTDVTIDSLKVSPEQVIQGAAVTDWATIGSVTNCSWVVGTGSSDVVNTVKMRRVGDCADFLITFSPNGSWAGDADQLSFKLPTGYTIDTTKQIYASDRSFIGTGELLDESATRKKFDLICIQDETDNQIIEVFCRNSSETYGTVANLTGTIPVTIQAGADSIWLRLDGVPISGWSSSVTMANRAVEEYAYNSSTNDGNDYTSFAYGLEGKTFVALTASASKRVRFKTVVQPTDQITLEVWDDISSMWYPHTANRNGSYAYNVQGTTNYGMWFTGVNSTDIDVTFATYANSTGASYGSAGSAWGGHTSKKWRVRKVSGGASVGFPVSARNVVGDVSGTAVPSGYIGETIECKSGGTGKNFSNNTFVTFSNDTGGGVAGGVVLTPGKWAITFMLTIEGSNSADYYTCAISTATGSNSPGLTGETSTDIKHVTPVSGIIASVAIPNYIVNLSSTTNYYGIVAASNNPTVNSGRGRLTAIRIA